MKLRNYQQKGVDHLVKMLTKDGSALLADDMGLGKTGQALTVAECLGVRRLMVVCPASLQLNWHSEISFWDYIGELLVVSYEWAVKHYKEVKKIDMLILDEAHYCKNRTAKRTKICFGPLWSTVDYRLLLTGTPCPNGIIDGWSLFNKLDPAAFPNRYSFGWRYCNVKTNWFTNQKEFYGANKKNLPELRRKINKFTVRRLKKEVLSELPPKTYTQTLLELPQAKDYRISESETRTALSSVLPEHAATRRKGVGLLKVARLSEIVENILLAKDRLVVWTYHQDVNANAVQALEPLNCTPLSITGSTPMTQRNKIIKRFQSDEPQKIVLVAQTEAAGIGVNLTAADTCLFLELDYRPHIMQQSIDRLHRIGQEGNVQVIYLVGKGTLDHQIIGSLRKKIEAIKGAVG